VQILFLVLSISSHGRKDQGSLHISILRAQIPVVTAFPLPLNHLLKAPVPHAIVLRVRISTYEVGRT
jgi:hypothetical protein